MDREYYCRECNMAYASNADVNSHHKYTGHIGVEHRDVIRRNLRTKRDEYGNVVKKPAFAPRPGSSDEPTQAEIDATLASIGQALGG